MAHTFREVVRFMLPSWMTQGEGGLVHYVAAAIIDAANERVRQGLRARFPSLAGPSALALIGEDRGIVRGRTEATEHYVQRLIAWRFPRGHRVRGNAFAMLEQIAEYFGGIRTWTIDRNQTRRARAVDGTETFTYDYAWNWDGIAASPRWGRFWIVIDPVPELPGVKPWPTFGVGTWGGAATIGAIARSVSVGQQGVTPDDCRAIRDLFRGRHPWHCAGTMPQVAILTFDGAAPVPAGSWAHYAGRNGAFRYWNVTP